VAGVDVLVNRSMFSYLRTLTTWHCPHSPSARRCYSSQSISFAAWAHINQPAPHATQAVPVISVALVNGWCVWVALCVGEPAGENTAW